VSTPGQGIPTKKKKKSVISLGKGNCEGRVWRESTSLYSMSLL